MAKGSSNKSAASSAPARPGASGGSALKRLKSSLKAAGVIGPQARVRKVSKKGSQKSKVAAAAVRLETRSVLRTMASNATESNPFELKFARQKHNVLGKKLQKGAVGRPGLTKKRSEEVRRKTLLVEMRRGNKASEVIDRRIGENDPTMSVEDRMLQRMMREKSGKTSHSNIFNLEDGEELTHMGRSLAETDSFDNAGLDRVSKDVQDDEDDGRITGDMVDRAHFGGFDDDDEPGHRKSHKEIMKEVIDKSKQHKRERQMQKEEDAGMRDQVDAEFNDIRGLLAPMDKRSERKNASAQVDQGAETIKPNQDYDRILREMAFERRARPTDRIKTDEELALEEKIKLEKLESERIRRMKGLNSDDEEDDDDDDQPSSKKDRRGVQGDDLDADDYEAYLDETIAAEKKMALTYKDGVLVNDKIFVKKSKVDSDEDSEEDDSDESGSDEDGDEDDEKNASDASDNSDQDASDGSAENDLEKDSSERGRSSHRKTDSSSKPDRDGSLEPEFDFSDDFEDDDDDRSAAYDSYSDSDASDVDAEIVAPNADVDDASTKSDSETQIDEEDVPYAPNAPETLTDFIELIDKFTPTSKSTIVKRLRILNNAKLGPDCAQKLRQIAILLVEYRNFVLSKPIPDMATLTALEGHTVELGRQFNVSVAEHALQRITEMQSNLEKKLSKSKTSGFPSLSEIYFLRLLGEIYSTSDKHHVVVTPAMLLMGQTLLQCTMRSGQDAFSGLFLCEVYLDYAHLSRRFIPEIVVFGYRLVALLIGKAGDDGASYIPDVEKNVSDVFAISDMSVEPHELRVSMLPQLVKTDTFSDSIKISLLMQTLNLLSRCARLWNEVGCNIEIFSPTIDLVCGLRQEELCESARNSIRTSIESIRASITSTLLKRRPLQLQKRKAIPIRTYMPKFEMGYSHERRVRQDPDRERAQASKLRAEFKKEQKGAVRELRKDAAFVSRQRLEDVKAKDAAYKSKIAKIMGQLASQEGAMRGYEREAKKRKRK